MSAIGERIADLEKRLETAQANLADALNFALKDSRVFLDALMRVRALEGRVEELTASLTHILDHYVALASSGDCGRWDPETEDEVIEARAVLAKGSA